MHFAILGSGAVGGYFGGQLARAGHRVSFVARGAHLRAIRERGLVVWSPLGDFVIRAEAEEDTAKIGLVDVVIVAVKTYDNDQALKLLSPMVGEDTVVLTLQNGVESAEQVAAAVGEARVLAGSTYIATALSLPGLIEQTGLHRKIVFGEIFPSGSGHGPEVSDRVRGLRDAMAEADIEVEAVPDARPALWEKFIYLSPFAAFTGAARLPIGPLWSEPSIREQILAAVDEVERVAVAEGVRVAAGARDRIIGYMDVLPASTRSSLLIDLSQGKRIEVEALLGAVVRRGRAVGVPTPVASTLYAVLKPHAADARGLPPPPA